MGQLPVERRVYIRLLDGVRLGQWERWYCGAEYNDVFEFFEPNVPIPDREFALPKRVDAVATNMKHFAGLVTGRVPLPPTPVQRAIRGAVVGILVLGAVVFGWLLWKAETRENTQTTRRNR